MKTNEGVTDEKQLEMTEFIENKIQIDEKDEMQADEEQDAGREQWGTKMDFLLSTIGFAVDLSNVFRFPYICYRNGGGAFLIPYFTMLIFCALPLFYMELILGQYNKQGCLTIWKMCPIFKGLGWASCILNCYVALFYNVTIAWAVYYMYQSFTWQLPWTTCDNTWNTLNCTVSENTTRKNGTSVITASMEYFENKVLSVHNSTGIDDLKLPKADLTLALFMVYVMLYFSLFKGVKSMGKAVWITAILPYIVLSILLVRGLFLKGAYTGILYFITPSFSKLLEPGVWCSAAVQIFFSIGVGFGVHTAYASYNPFKNNVFRDCLIATGVNSFTSIFSGLVVFSYLGYMATEFSTSIKDIAKENSGLIFIVYSEALATIKFGAFWSILFFIMLITLGLDSSFGAMEAMLTAIRDEFYSFFKRFRYDREILTLVTMIGLYLLAMPNITYGGFYLVTFMENYSAGFSLLLVVFFECIAVSWVYGVHKFNSNITEMENSTSIFWSVMWKFVTPIILVGIIIAYVSITNELSLQLSTHVYFYPSWSKIVGSVMVAIPTLCIPITMIYQLYKSKGATLKEKFCVCISPISEHNDITRNGVFERLQIRHWFRMS